MSDHPVDALDQWEFDDKAAMAASMLAQFGHAFVDVQPRDATTYKIVVVQPLIATRSYETWRIYPDTYWVGTSFGPLYQFHPKHAPYSWDYVLDKWVDGDGGTAQWTARVIARFLNALAERINAMNDLEHEVIAAAFDVAAAAPRKQGQHVYAAQIPWSTIWKLRGRLEDLGWDWEKACEARHSR